MRKRRLFNFKMIDGALVLMEYTFNKRELIHHRLCFFPSPDLLEYQSHEELYLEDDIYLDILSKQVVTVPLRFDFFTIRHTANIAVKFGNTRMNLNRRCMKKRREYHILLYPHKRHMGIQ